MREWGRGGRGDMRAWAWTADLGLRRQAVREPMVSRAGRASSLQERFLQGGAYHGAPVLAGAAEWPHQNRKGIL